MKCGQKGDKFMTVYLEDIEDKECCATCRFAYVDTNETRLGKLKILEVRCDMYTDKDCMPSQVDPTHVCSKWLLDGLRYNKEGVYEELRKGIRTVESCSTCLHGYGIVDPLMEQYDILCTLRKGVLVDINCVCDNYKKEEVTECQK